MLVRGILLPVIAKVAVRPTPVQPGIDICRILFEGLIKGGDRLLVLLFIKEGDPLLYQLLLMSSGRPRVFRA